MRQHIYIYTVCQEIFAANKFCVLVVQKDPRNYSFANFNEKMAADGIMYHFCL